MKLKIFLLAIANAIGYSVHAQQQLTGAIDGVFDVSNLGAATYTIPVSIPEGIGGMKPSVSINYNSQNTANGNLGIGWSVTGVSAISRAGSTILLEGKTAGATVTTDKFALDGNRLVRIGDLNSTANYVYATESEAFLKIEGQNTGSDFQSFKVTDQSGLLSEYGIAANSRQNIGSLTYTWMLARQTDLNGNTINYDYHNVAGEEIRLKTITYGGGTTPLNRITFHYVTKSAQNFVYVSGQKVDSKYKLDKITIESTGGTGNVYTLLYTYQFEYTAQKDQLAKVRHISNHTNQEMPGTNFQYENSTPAEVSSTMALDALSDYEEIIVGDFNGDGKSDFILYDNNLSSSNTTAGLLHLNNGANDFPIIQGITIPKVPQHYIDARYHYDRLNRSSFFDFNGDGREDLYTLSPTFSISNPPTETVNEYSIFTSELDAAYPGGIQLIEKEKIKGGTGGGSSFYATYPVVGDFDGDGLSEIVILSKSTSSDLRNYILGLKYSPVLGPAEDPYRRGAFLPNMPFNATQVEATGQWDRSKIFAIDYNGDGKTEILYIRQGVAKVYELNVTFDSNQNPVIGNPAFVEVSSDGYPTSAHEVFMGDFNGDGMLDVLTYADGAGWEIGYGKGNGKFNDIRSISGLGINKHNCYYSSPAILIADFNGDGKSDIFDAADPGAGPSCPGYGARIHYSNGNHSFETKNYAINGNQISYSNRMLKLGDFNGDGSADIIGRRAMVSSYDFYIHKFRPFDDTKLLTKVVNGLGVKTRIEYTKHTKDYFPLYGASSYFSNVSYPFVSKPLPISLVKSVYNDAGFYASLEHKVDYQFKKFTWANLGRGMLGFQEMVVTDNARNVTTTQTTTTNADKLLLLPESTSVSKNGSSVSLSKSYFEVKSFTGNRFGVYPKFTESFDNLTGQNLREDYSFQETYNDGMGGIAIESTYHIGKPIKKITNKGFYRNFLNLFTIKGALETITQTFSYPNPNVIVIGNPMPFHRYFLPGRIQKTTVRKGQDPFSDDIRFVYNDAKGWVTKKRDNYGLPHAVTTDYTYNTFGNLVTQTVSSTGCPTVAETIEYDPTNRFVKSRYNMAYPLLKSINTYNGYTGRLSSTADNVSGITETFGYDGFGRAISVSDNTGIQKTTTVSAVQQGAPGDAVYTVTEFNNITNNNVWKHYDRLGRLLRTARVDFNGDVLFEDNIYNAIGQLTSSSLPYKESGGTPVYTSFSYDNMGRQTQISAPNGNTLISYNLTPNTSTTNNVARYTVTTTGPDGIQRAVATDAAGKKVRATDPGGSLDFTYHSSGQILNTALNGSIVTSSVYNGAGREVEKYDVNYGAYLYAYDNYGKLKTQTDPKGNQYVMDYDAMGNMISKTGSEGTYNYTYNLSTAGFSLGKLTGITAPGAISENYSYGSFGRLTQEVKTIDGISFTNAYGYDGFGRLSRKYFANFVQGITLNIGYNSNDGSYERTYLSGGTIQDPKNLYAVLTKNVLGQTTFAGLQSVFYSGPITDPSSNPFYKLNRSGAFDNVGRPQYAMTKATNGGNYFQDQYYSFNAANNLDTRVNSSTNDEVESFDYDNLNRLITTNSYVGANSFDYTAIGNITQKSDAGTFTYNSDNKVAEIAPFTNIPSETQTITYTPFSKVATITEGSITAEFKYWPNGERAKMELKNNGVTFRTKYYMDDFEREISGGQTRDLVYVRGEQDQYVSIVERINNTNEKTYSIITDYLSSIERIVDNSNLDIVADKSYDAWGRERNAINWSYLPVTHNSTGWDRGFTGHEHIPEFGLINMNGRLYDPVLGRMISPDPYIMGADNTQGYNRYTYALNNPMSYNDPSGEWVQYVIGAIIGGFSGWKIADAAGYTGWKKFGYTVAGAAVGAISGGLGAAVSSAGGVAANTMGIVASSFVNSLGTAAYTGGKTSLSVSFGIGSYNFDSGEFGYLGKKGNSALENIGYGFGALANLQDIVAWNQGAINETRAEHGDGVLHARSRGQYKDANGVSQNYDISVAHPPMPAGTYKYDLSQGDPGYSGLLENLDYARYWGFHDYQGTYYAPSAAGWKATLYNVNAKSMNNMYENINNGLSLGGGSPLRYGYPWGGCYGQVARALFRVGVPTVPFYGFTPHGLVMQLWVRQAGIYASPILINK